MQAGAWTFDLASTMKVLASVSCFACLMSCDGDEPIPFGWHER